MIKSPTVLAHYDGTQKLILVCDASPIWVGAVIANHTKVVKLACGGWSENVSDVPSDCISYYRRETELSLLDGCLFQPS